MRNSSSTGDRAVIGKTAGYALRALLVLARTDGRLLTAAAIAQRTGAPANYMSKTLHTLARAGLVRGARGPSGGFALATAAEEISIAHIADLFAETCDAPRCLLGTGTCNSASPCAVHQRWRDVVCAVRHPLTTTTLAHLLETETSTATAK
jgi:Rrf2 family transcriptional regulator, iron-sulfur cluster assembly transcription factor